MCGISLGIGLGGLALGLGGWVILPFAASIIVWNVFYDNVLCPPPSQKQRLYDKIGITDESTLEDLEKAL